MQRNRRENIQQENSQQSKPNAIQTNETSPDLDLSNLRAFVINDQDRNKLQFGQNYIKTTKYTLYSFLPLSILNQYKRIANIYFLLLCILCLIPEISPWDPVTQILPTLFVLGIAIIREAIEDYYRYLSDTHSNKQAVFKVLGDGSIQQQISSSIVVGDIIWVQNETEIPADILVIGGGNLQETNNGQIECFVKTSSLDGEKNLKKKVSPKFLKIESDLFQQKKQSQSQKLFPILQGQIICELPNKDLLQFHGILKVLKKHQFETLDQQQDYPKEYILQESNLLLKGTKLMNTQEGVVGVVIYCGQDTKLLQNQNRSRFKQSRVELETNKIVIGMLFYIIIASLVLAWLSYRQNINFGDSSYYLYNLQSQGLPSKNSLILFIETFLSNICLNCTFIPTSLIVAIEISKVIQAFFIIQDVELVSLEYDEEILVQNSKIVNSLLMKQEINQDYNVKIDLNNQFDQNISIQERLPRSMNQCVVHTCSLNEELGQVRYIFSDKTGTLTKNIMEFRMCKIGQQIYGDQTRLNNKEQPTGHKQETISKRHNADDENIQNKSANSCRSNNEWDQASQRSKMSDGSYISKLSKRSNTNLNQGASYSYLNQNLEEIIFKLDQNETAKCPIQMISQNRKTIFNFQNQKVLVNEFLKLLSVTHECMAIKAKNSSEQEVITYQGTSPDEIALLEFTEKHGFQFVFSSDELIQVSKKIKLQQTHGEWSYDETNLNILDQINDLTLDFQLIKKFEFNSDRKRMSVVVKDKQDGFYKIYTKGADNVIKERLKPFYFQQKKVMNKNLSYEYNFQEQFLNDNQKFQDSEQSIQDCQKILKDTNNFLHKASIQGYRTLLVSMKILDEAEVQELIQDCDNAEKDIQRRNENLAQVFEKWEKDMYLIGATVVEDRLQDQVPETIKALHQADIKLWVLTGDKLETAESVGYSCQLLDDEMDIMLCRNEHDARMLFTEEQAKQNQSLVLLGKKRAIIIESFALKFLLSLENFQIKRWFLKISRTMETVICCRVSPSQKAEVVRMIKQDDPDIISLAIGDGANDVPMILEADIGIGLFGKEGMRAADSSDFAIGEFRHLWTLLFKWGRWNYTRQCMNINYYFYKNFVYTLFQILFQASNFYSSQTIFPDIFLTLFNMMFTTWPIGSYSTNEVDFYPSTLESEDIQNYYKQNTGQQDFATPQFAQDPLTSIKAYDPAYLRFFIPYLYYPGQRNLQFNQWVFIWWILRGLFECLVIYIVTYMIFTDGHILNQSGEAGDLWTFGMTVFTSLIFVVTIKIMLKTLKFDALMLTAILFLTFFFYYMCIYITDPWYMGIQYCFTFFILYRMPLFYLTVVFCISICFIIDLLFESFSKLIMTDTKDFLRQELSKRDFIISKQFINEFQKLNNLQTNISMIEDELKEHELDIQRSINSGPEQSTINQQSEQSLNKSNSNIYKNSSLTLISLKIVRVFQNMLFRYTNLAPYNTYNEGQKKNQYSQMEQFNIGYFAKQEQTKLMNNEIDVVQMDEQYEMQNLNHLKNKIRKNKVIDSPINNNENQQIQYSHNLNSKHNSISNINIYKSNGQQIQQEQFLKMRDEREFKQIQTQVEIKKNLNSFAKTLDADILQENNSFGSIITIPQQFNSQVDNNRSLKQMDNTQNKQNQKQIQLKQDVFELQQNIRNENKVHEVDKMFNDLGFNQESNNAGSKSNF